MAVEIQNYGEGVDSRYDAENPASYYQSSTYRKLDGIRIEGIGRTVWVVEQIGESLKEPIRRMTLGEIAERPSERVRKSRRVD